MRIDDTLIPGERTKYIQASVVFWNKSFKGSIMKFYDEWSSLLQRSRKHENCITPFES